MLICIFILHIPAFLSPSESENSTPNKNNPIFRQKECNFKTLRAPQKRTFKTLFTKRKTAFITLFTKKMWAPQKTTYIPFINVSPTKQQQQQMSNPHLQIYDQIVNNNKCQIHNCQNQNNDPHANA